MVFAIPPFPRLEGSAAARELFLHGAVRPLNDRAGAAAMKAAISPFFALDFKSELVSLVIGERLNDFCAMLRSPPSRSRYAAFALHIKLTAWGILGGLRPGMGGLAIYPGLAKFDRLAIFARLGPDHQLTGFPLNLPTDGFGRVVFC